LLSPALIVRRALVGLLVVLTIAAGAAFGPQGSPPQDRGPVPGYTPLVAPDGTIEHYFTRGGPVYPDTKTPYGKQDVMRMRSRDEGRTWTKPEPVLSLPKEGKWFDYSPHGMYDSRGQLHLFILDMTDREMGFWHTRTVPGSGQWSKLQYIGTSGPMNNPIQLRTGRIVIPVGYFRSGSQPPSNTKTVGSAFEADLKADKKSRDRISWDDPIGIWESTTYYSDDEGTSWKRSPAVLTIPVPTDYPGRHPGACEPVILELKDGRVWMLIRNQTGYLYESFSADGVSWSEPRATRFLSSDSPASVVRLPGGEIVLVWNNCLHPAPRDGAFIYTGRDALHAALSPDEGKTWVGYREIYRDPFRNQSHVAGMGDRGTSYACAAVSAAGNVLVISGQGTNRRRFIVVDPNWLRATHDEDNFAQGAENWSIFKGYGAVKAWGSPRTEGAECIAHPSRAGAKVLHVRRPDDKPGDGAVWNFPIGWVGKVSARILLRKGFQGALVSLTDRFFHPEIVDMQNTTFALPIAGDGRLNKDVILEKERWYEIELAWQVEQKVPGDRWPGTCKVLVDGREAMTLPQLNRAQPGVGYLRLNSTAGNVDPAGFLVERVAADIARKQSSPSTGR